MIEGMKNAKIKRNPFTLYVNTLIEIYSENYREALNLLLSSEIETIENQFIYIHKSHLNAQIYGFMGNSVMAKVYYDSARVVYEVLLKENQEDARLYTSLGIVYAGLGRKEDAIREGKRGVELLPISKEAWRGAYRVEDLAVIYTMVGEYDLAIDQIETLLSMPSDLSVNLLRLNPKWNPLREHPRFIKLIQKYGA